MRIPLKPALAALVVVACSDPSARPTAGQDAPPKGALMLARLLVEDPATRFITDLLDTGPAKACSLRDPCPAGVEGLAATECRIEGDAGICVDPLAAQAVPTENPLQIRLVFDRRLASDTLAPGDGGAVLREPGSVRLLDAEGREVEADKDYDNSGSANDTIDPFVVPLGPALVLSPRAPLAPDSVYSLRIDAARILDGQGRALATDVHGPVAASYALRTQPALPGGAELDASAPDEPPLVGGWFPRDGAADDGAADDGASQ